MPHSFRNAIHSTTSAPSGSLLPICHVAKTSDILNFIRLGKVFTSELCDVFNEPLNYFFYGRAAYRPSKTGATPVAIDQPAAIILSPDVIANPFSVFPFDTGAFPRYANVVNGHKLADFELEKNLADCERVIERYWKSLSAYMFAELAEFQSFIDPNCPEAECYSAIVRDLSAEDADDRRSAIEVTSRDDVWFGPDQIVGLVLPRAYAQADEVLELSANGTRVQKYNYQQGFRQSYMSVVVEDASRIVEAWVDHG